VPDAAGVRASQCPVLRDWGHVIVVEADYQRRAAAVAEGRYCCHFAGSHNGLDGEILDLAAVTRVQPSNDDVPALAGQRRRGYRLTRRLVNSAEATIRVSA
jgi:hypothetical protein